MVHPGKHLDQWFNRSQARQYLLFGMCILGVAAAIFGVRWYFSGQQGKAQQVYSEAAVQYRKGLSGIAGAWEDLEYIAQIGYEHHKSSVFGSYFLALKAEAQVHQGKTQDALRTSEEMMAQLPKYSPLYFVYKTKLALLRLDSEDRDIRKKGLENLNHIAYDQKNINKDEARYYLGLYQSIAGDKEEAKKTWTSLVEEQGIYEAEKGSLWAQLAESKLTGL